MKTIIAMKRNNTLLFVWPLLFLLSACTPGNTYHKMADIPNFSWQRSDTLDFEVKIADTLSDYDLFLIIRHNNDYPFTNLWIDFYTIFPDGDTLKVRKQLHLADNDEQRWKGECMGDICVAKVPLITDARFPQRGIYVFRIHHVMRSNPLPGVMNVGLEMRKREGD